MSRMMMKALIVTVLMILTCAQIRADDEIWRKGSAAPLKVDKVTQEDFEEVKYRKRGIATEQRISADKVVKIVYGDAPHSFKQGLKFYDNLDYENAVNSFKLSGEASNVRDWIKTYSRYWLGLSYQAWGSKRTEKYSDAIKAYDSILRDDPKSRFYAEVLLNLADCYASQGDVSNAVATYDRLGKEAYDKKLGILWEARAKHYKAIARLNGNLLDEAERNFRSSESFCREQARKSEDPGVLAELEMLAGLDLLAQGSVLIQRKRYSQAKTFFDDILKNDSSPIEAKAGAQNGLAQCSLAEKRVKEAQLEFATTKVLYGSIVEEASKATYYLGVCCLELKDKEPKYKKKAQDYFEEVISLYPASTWAKEARKQLK